MAKWPYSTGRWRRLRADKLAAVPYCEYCPPKRRSRATEVDHRRAIADGGDPWDWMNLASACRPCHSRKTAAMDGGGGNAKRKAMPVRGVDPATGRPLDPEHWWNHSGKISQG